MQTVCFYFVFFLIFGGVGAGTCTIRNQLLTDNCLKLSSSPSTGPCINQYMIPRAQYYFFGTLHLGLETEGLKAVKDGLHGENSRVEFIKQLEERANFICRQRKV
jgi:hypothetical protein